MSEETVKGVFNDDGTQLFPDAVMIRAQVSPSAVFPQHPLEDGSSISDHRIFKQIKIALSVILKPETFQSTLAEINAAYVGTDSLTVVTRSGSYSNMYIESDPHDEQATMFDTVAIILNLVEVQFATTVYTTLPASSVSVASNASTTKTGQKQANDASSSQTSAAYDLFFGAQ